MTAAEREPQPGDMLSCPPHPKDRRQSRPVKEVGSVNVFDGVKMMLLPRYSGSRYADAVSEEKWGDYIYVSRKDGGTVSKSAMTYGEIFRLQRKRLMLSLRDVAKASGVATATLSRFERGGDIHFALLVKASRAIKLSLDDIADGVKGCLPASKKENL